jgi:hypothetical protein
MFFKKSIKRQAIKIPFHYNTYFNLIAIEDKRKGRLKTGKRARFLFYFFIML